MKRRYRDRDYDFGQAMLGLRTAMGFTQTGLANTLGVTRRAVGDWEAGESYPNSGHLTHLIGLAVEQKAFHSGHELEEIRALWKISHQKVPLDEIWLSQLLGQTQAPQSISKDNTSSANVGTIKARSSKQRLDWNNAILVPNFYGREWELAELTRWILEQNCQLVGVLGLGGIGKSSLSINMMHAIAEHFDVVVWRSLRDAPSCEALLDDCLQILAPQPFGYSLESLEKRFQLLQKYLRNQRALVVLDNLETLFEEGEDAGQMRSGYEDYDRLLSTVAETKHQSCLLFTSREKPASLVALEGVGLGVHSLRLNRLETRPCVQLLAEKGVAGSEVDITVLVDAYAGNPLALKIVAQTIVDLFDGKIAPFLNQGEIIFGGIRTLLDKQIARLSALEQSVLMWLAIMREPVTLDEIRSILFTPVPRARLLEAIDALYRRSLIERGHMSGSFSLQSVVLEYATLEIIAQAGEEILTGKLSWLIEYGLLLARSQEYVRQNQERLILTPLLLHLRTIQPDQEELESGLLLLLNQLRTRKHPEQGYGPANLLVLLRMLRGNLRRLDLSNLLLRGMYLQGVDMQDTSLSRSLIQDNVFSQAFSAVLAVDVSNSGNYWVASSSRGEIIVWTLNGFTLHNIWRAHGDMIWAIKISPDERYIASGGWDAMLKIWDISTCALVWSGKHQSGVNSVIFSPDGHLVASASGDHNIVIWDLASGSRLRTLPHPTEVTGTGINWSPDGRFIISGDHDGYIRLWDVTESDSPHCVQAIVGHSTTVDGLALSPDGQLLVSACIDGTVKLWDVTDGQLHLRLRIVGHLGRIGRMAWSHNGRMIACGGIDNLIWLFDIEEGRYFASLQGHTSGVTGLAFVPDDSRLLSGGDESMRLWDLDMGLCMHLIEGYSRFLFVVGWSPDSRYVVGGGVDKVVTLWDLSNEDVLPRLLHGHNGAVNGIGWSSDGQWLASSEWDNVIRLWDPVTGANLRTFHYPFDNDNFFSTLEWSPGGTSLACGTNQNGIQIYEVTDQPPHWIGKPLHTSISRLAWSPDGTQLAAGGGDSIVYLWDVIEDSPKAFLPKHYGTINALAWSPDGTKLISGSRGREGGELFVWDVMHGEQVQSIKEHPGIVHTVAWGLSEDTIISGDEKGILRWWNTQSGKCLFVRQAHLGAIRSIKRSPDGKMLASCGDDGTIMLWDIHTGEHFRTLRRDRPYERLNITGIKGLTDVQKATLYTLGAVDDDRL